MSSVLGTVEAQGKESLSPPMSLGEGFTKEWTIECVLSRPGRRRWSKKKGKYI